MNRWIAVLGLFMTSVIATKANDMYPGAVPCPSNSSIVGYTNLTALNSDIFGHYSASSENAATPPTYDYVLCPETTFIVGSGEAIVPATDESAISCGDRHDPAGNCVLLGGSFQVYFLDFLALQNIYFRGITFKGSSTASVYGDAHPTSLVYFIDCIFKRHDGISTVYIFFTPYEPQRRLNSHESLGRRPTIVDEYEKITENKEYDRDLQVDIRYSMGVFFRSCHFTGNKADDAIILNVGGEVALLDTKFDNNEAEKLAIFSTLNNGHAYLASGTIFNSNNARLGPVFVDSVSFLQYSEDSDGANNVGHQCGAIFIEEMGSNCVTPALDGICNGDCCEFGDTSCDLHTEAPVPVPVLTSSPTSSVIRDTTSTGSPTATLIHSKPGKGESVELSNDNNVQLDGLIEKESDVSTESGVCSGYCIAFSIVLTFYLLLVAGLVFMGIQRRRMRKGTVDGSVELSDRDIDDKSFS